MKNLESMILKLIWKMFAVNIVPKSVYKLGKITQNSRRIKMFTDKLPMFYILTKAAITTEMQLYLDPQCGKDAC